MILLIYKESFLNLEESNPYLPSLAISLLQEFDDISRRTCLVGCHPFEALDTRLISFLELSFQID